VEILPLASRASFPLGSIFFENNVKILNNKLRKINFCPILSSIYQYYIKELVLELGGFEKTQDAKASSFFKIKPILNLNARLNA
jgi:hypothetical protein